MFDTAYLTLQLQAIFGDGLLEQEPMSKHTNFRLGGPARWFAVVRTQDELQRAIDICDAHRVPWVVIGGGSNTLVADEGFNGLVLHMGMREVQVEGTHVTADAGVLSAYLARFTAQAGLAGFTWAISLPGTIGGAVRGNAGCFGGETADCFVSARVLRNGRVVEYTKDALQFGYRDSVLKHEPGIVLSATFQFSSGDPAYLQADMDRVLMLRKTTQPQSVGSAGCMFKNVSLHSDDDVQRARQFGDIDSVHEMIARRKISSGWLIDYVGLKGLTHGGASVSQEHGNFLVNHQGATASDVYHLAQDVKKRVQERTGFLLDEEVAYVGFRS